MTTFGKLDRRMHHSITTNHYDAATAMLLLVTVQIHDVLHTHVQRVVPESISKH